MEVIERNGSVNEVPEPGARNGVEVGFIRLRGAARAGGGGVGVNVGVLVSEKPSFVEEKRKNITKVFRERKGGIVDKCKVVGFREAKKTARNVSMASDVAKGGVVERYWWFGFFGFFGRGRR